MKKKLFSIDLIFKEFISKKYVLNIPPLDLEVDKIIAICSSTKGLTVPQIDGIYFDFITHKKLADGRVERCKKGITTIFWSQRSKSGKFSSEYCY